MGFPSHREAPWPQSMDCRLASGGRWESNVNTFHVHLRHFCPKGTSNHISHHPRQFREDGTRRGGGGDRDMVVMATDSFMHKLLPD